MTNNSKKAEQFIKAINAQADLKCSQIKKEIDAYVSSELRKAREAAKKNAKNAAKLEIIKLSEQSNTDSYKTRSQLIMQIIEKRNAITDTVFSKARERIKEFTDGEDYLPFLKKSIQSITDAIGGDTVILIRPQDEKFIGELKGMCKEIKTDGSIILGGCKGINDKNSMRADDTLDSRLEAQRELFYEKSGLSII